LRGQQRSNALLLPDQDHRAIKRITRPMLGFGIEVMHMIRKGQMKTENGTHPSAAEQFYSLVR
jgi:putative transposase